jgi:hypothetical protein
LRFTIAALEYAGSHNPCRLLDSQPVVDIIINIIRRDLRLPTDSETKWIFEQRQVSSIVRQI